MKTIRIEMAGDWHLVTAHGKPPRLTERVAEDKALQKAITKLMKRMSDVVTRPPSFVLRTVPWRDTRHLAGGGRMNDPATAFYSDQGGYVVRNNRTGDIIQVSDRTNRGWKAPWD